MKKAHKESIILLTALVCFIGLRVIAQPTSQSGTTGITTPVSADPERYSDGLKKWTSRDSVAVRYFIPNENIVVSPDGTHFFFVSFRGDVTCDCNVQELSVFATEDVRLALSRVGPRQTSPPQPLRSLVRRSSNIPGVLTAAIGSPRWERDGESVSFRGPDEKGIQQFYLFNVRSGKVTALTNWAHDSIYSIRESDTVISNLIMPAPPPAPPDYPVYAITRNDLIGAMYADKRKTQYTKPTTFVSYRGGAPWEVKAARALDFQDIWFSSDAQRAAVLGYPKEAPGGWNAYDQLARGVKKKTDFPQFMLVDAEHGRSEPVFDAPTGEATKVGTEASSKGVRPQSLWANNNRHVILVNTALPLTPGENPERIRMAYVVGYDLHTGKWKAIEPLESSEGGVLRRVTQVGWLKPGQELLIGHEVEGKPVSRTVYTLNDDRWIGRTVDATVKLPKAEPRKQPSLTGGLSVTIRQSANDPPIVVASDGKNDLALTPADPALAGLWWARQEPFQWREPSGKMETGGLLLPRNAKGPVPLVIQVYSYEPNLFRPDGQDVYHAYAAQSLVAQGMAVLNVNIPGMDNPPVLGDRELPEFVARVESATDALASRGLIDRTRVGLIGFSRAGFNVAYAITHPGKYPPAAAVIDDAFPGTYSSYLSMRARSAPVQDFERLYGGSFWQNKAAWIEREPSFNVDRVETPALFTIHHQQGVSQVIEKIGSFLLNRRPLEYLVFPDGKHQLTMPRHRLASYEASVDWMSFWLLGKIPPDPERAARWAELREQQEAVLAEAAAKGEKRAPLPPLVPARQSSTTAVKQN